MPNDPFVILGIEKGATQSEILEAYKEKRAHYQQLVFEEGETGADAARMLEELDKAYQLAMEYSHDTASVSGESYSSDPFEEVRTAIKNKDFTRAQNLLDNMSNRGGEWHYYQAIVYYEKSWLNESKKQLEIALSLEPGNEKYQRALDNMKKKIDGTNAFKNQRPRQNYQGQEAQEYHRSYQQQPDAADNCCTACQALWCADCCCECMGGDCIRCC